MITDTIKGKRLVLIPADKSVLEYELNKKKYPDALKDIIIPENWPHKTITKNVTEIFISLLNQDRLYNFYWVYEGKSGDKILIGSGGIIVHETGEYEIGYSVLEQFENYGFATEAIESIVKWFGSSGLGYKLIAKTDDKNYPSIKVLEKTGFTFSGLGNEPGSLIYSINFNDNPRYP